MAEVINLNDVRRQRDLSTKSGTTDADAIEIFPSVSLADLWRAWTWDEQAPRDIATAQVIVRTRMG